MRFRRARTAAAAIAGSALIVTLGPEAIAGGDGFSHVATYDVSGEVAEIVAATPDGRTLVYTDSGAEVIGLVNITDPSSPSELSTLTMTDEPTSVAVTPNGRWALAAIADGSLAVIDIADPTSPWVRRTIQLGGQPDSIALTRDGAHAAIAIENERDEEVNEGAMPQAPAGFLAVLDLHRPWKPWTWQVRRVDLRGIADRFPFGPEPEFVDINAHGIAAVTLQENNHVVQVDVSTGEVVREFPMGTVTHAADLQADGTVDFGDVLKDARREADAIGWLDGRLITANEGDYDLDTEFVGGRGWSMFARNGYLLFDSGAALERRIAAAGLYDDTRSENKGVEPEGVEVGRYHDGDFVFIGAERADAVAVYRIIDGRPAFIQVLATGDEPEGLLAITTRGLFVSANEEAGTIDIFSRS